MTKTEAVRGRGGSRPLTSADRQTPSPPQASSATCCQDGHPLPKCSIGHPSLPRHAPDRRSPRAVTAYQPRTGGSARNADSARRAGRRFPSMHGARRTSGSVQPPCRRSLNAADECGRLLHLAQCVSCDVSLRSRAIYAMTDRAHDSSASSNSSCSSTLAESAQMGIYVLMVLSWAGSDGSTVTSRPQCDRPPCRTEILILL